MDEGRGSRGSLTQPARGCRRPARATTQAPDEIALARISEIDSPDSLRAYAVLSGWRADASGGAPAVSVGIAAGRYAPGGAADEA